MTVLQTLIGPEYEAESKAQTYRKLVNWYPQNNFPGGEYPWSWIPCPGTKTWLDTTQRECRAIYSQGDFLYIIAGNTFYKADKETTLTVLGTLGTSEGEVSITSSLDELLIADGSDGYSYVISTSTFTLITAESFPDTTRSITQQNGYFIAVKPDTKTYFVSDVDDATAWDPLSFISKSVYGDDLVAVQSFKSFIWVFGTKTTEVHYLNPNTISGSAPFERYPGILIDLGVAAPKSIINAGDTFFWISTHEDGGYFIVQASQDQAQPISNRSISRKLNELGTIKDCVAWAYTQNSHEFVVFNFPTDKKSYVYDLTVQQWHERSYRTARGKDEQHIGQSYAFFDGKHLVASRINGKVLHLDSETYDDNDGDLIKRLGIIGPIESDARYLTMNNLHLQTKTGMGVVTGQGSDPQLMFRVSRDYGNTWGQVYFKSPGKLGEYRDRVLWARVATSRSITLEISATDPVDWIIKGGRADIKVGNA